MGWGSLVGCHLWSRTESDTTEATEQQQQLVAQTVKNLPAMQETWVQSLDWEDPLEKEMATPSSILAWIIPWTEEPGRLQSMGLQSRTQLSYFTSITVQCSPSSKGYCGHSISQKKMRHVFFKFWGSNLSQLFLKYI